MEALRAEGCIPATQYLNVMYADNGKTAGENDAALDDIVAAMALSSSCVSYRGPASA